MKLAFFTIILLVALFALAILIMKRKPKADKVNMHGVEVDNATFLPEVIRVIEEGHTATIMLKGYSMRPFLENGRDKAVLTKPTTPTVGKPVLAEIMPGRFVLHRIIDIKGDEVTLLGDGNLRPEHCRLQDIRADVVGFYRKGRLELDLTSGLKWRTYSKVWMALRPARRYLLAFYRRIWLRLTR